MTRSLFTLAQSLSLVVRQAAGVETYMNSVERVVYYAEEVEQEKYKGNSELQPPASWPTTGSIEMTNLQLSYRPELPPVLKGLTMRLQSGEKLGIVGRCVVP